MLVYPASLIAHELAHAALYLLLSPARAAGITAWSGWFTVQIERDVLPPVRDILVTLAGPLARMAICALPQLMSWALAQSFAMRVALLPALFFVVQHVGSLLPSSKDYAALIAAAKTMT